MNATQHDLEDASAMPALNDGLLRDLIRQCDSMLTAFGCNTAFSLRMFCSTVADGDPFSLHAIGRMPAARLEDFQHELMLAGFELRPEFIAQVSCMVVRRASK